MLVGFTIENTVHPKHKWTWHPRMHLFLRSKCGTLIVLPSARIVSIYYCVTPGASGKLGGFVQSKTVKAAFRVVLVQGIAFRVGLAAVCLLRVLAPTSLQAVASDLALELKPGVIERR
jgi:hypothetical protein